MISLTFLAVTNRFIASLRILFRRLPTPSRLRKTRQMRQVSQLQLISPQTETSSSRTYLTSPPKMNLDRKTESSSPYWPPHFPTTSTPRLMPLPLRANTHCQLSPVHELPQQAHHSYHLATTERRASGG
jgi:hypothetical protein